MKNTRAQQRIHCGRAWPASTRFCGVCATRLRRGGFWTLPRVAAALGVSAAAMVLAGTAVMLAGDAAACAESDGAARVRASSVLVSTEDALGTGVVVRDGLVMTAAHVVGDDAVASIETAHARLRGRVVGVDAERDLAFIRTDTDGLPAAAFSNESALAAGDRLLALGYPAGLAGEPTITGGVFSALRREGGVTYVQTDAALNPGNSGGPLFTACGDLVGINVAMLESAPNINFAVAASEVERAIDEQD
jgi:S1-C subfamily serine protease